MLIAGVLLLPNASVAQTIVHFEQPISGIESFPARVDGHQGLYIFDSGIGASAVTPGTARAIGCTPWGKVTGFRAIGERIDEQRCNSATLAIGTISRRLPQLSVLDLERYMGPPGRQFAGAVGLDAFDGKIVTLSVSTHSLTIENEQSAKLIAQVGTKVPIRLVRAAEGAALTANIGVRTRSGLLWMEIDSGNYGPSLIDKQAAPLLTLGSTGSDLHPLMATVAADSYLGGTAIVRDLIMDGDLGREGLKNWDITLDLARGCGWIRPASGTVSH